MRQLKGETGVSRRLFAVETPFVAVRQNRPIEITLAGFVFGVMKVILDLLAWKPARRLLLGNLVERMLHLLGFQNGRGFTENIRGIGFLRRALAGFTIQEKTIVGALSRDRLGRQILFRYKGPSDFIQERVKELSARVGFFASGQADIIFEPAFFQPLVNRLRVSGRWKTF
ncbi:MAG: hypothetical protein ABSC03_02945 [Verrucomicrobiota bacterium]